MGIKCDEEMRSLRVILLEAMRHTEDAKEYLEGILEEYGQEAIANQEKTSGEWFEYLFNNNPRDMDNILTQLCLVCTVSSMFLIDTEKSEMAFRFEDYSSLVLRFKDTNNYVWELASFVRLKRKNQGGKTLN